MPGSSVLWLQQDWCMYERSGAVAAHAGSAENQARRDPRTERGKWTQVLTPKQDAIYSWYLLAKGKLVFSNRVSLGRYIKHMSGNDHAWSR